jgi:hypothetical protein
MPRALQAPFSVTMGSASALRQRPTLAAAIGLITAMWADIEHELGLIMASILGIDAPLGIAIYLNLRSEGPQHKVLKTAAKTRLPAKGAGEIVRFVESLPGRGKARNDIVHGLWGVSDKHPDHLIWLSKSDSMQARSQDKRWVGTNITIKSTDIASMANRPRFMIYEERDFTNISTQLEEYLKEALWLHANIVPE